MVFPVVPGQDIGHIAQLELAKSDAVGVATDQAAKMELVIEVAVEGVIPQHHISAASIAIRNFEGNQSSTEVSDPGLNAIPVGQGIQIDADAVGCPSELALRHSCLQGALGI